MLPPRSASEALRCDELDEAKGGSDDDHPSSVCNKSAMFFALAANSAADGV